MWLSAISRCIQRTIILVHFPPSFIVFRICVSSFSSSYPEMPDMSFLCELLTVFTLYCSRQSSVSQYDIIYIVLHSLNTSHLVGINQTSYQQSEYSEYNHSISYIDCSMVLQECGTGHTTCISERWFWSSLSRFCWWHSPSSINPLLTSFDSLKRDSRRMSIPFLFLYRKLGRCH